MLHIAQHNENHLKAISQFRSMMISKEKDPNNLVTLSFSTNKKADFVLPHDVYQFDLAEYKANPNSQPMKTGTRTIESKGNEDFGAMYDVKDDAKGGSTVSNAQIDSEYLKRYQKALEILVKQQEMNTGEYELRLLRFNALGMEAIWAHNNESSKDLYVPVVSFYGIKPYQVYKAREFFDLLKGAANNVKLGTDNTMAP